MKHMELKKHHNKKQRIGIDDTVSILFAISAIIALFSKIDLFILLTVFTGIPLIISSRATMIKKVIFTLALLLYCGMWRTPATPSDFEQYLAAEHAVYCIGVECLQVLEGEAYNPEAEIGQIQALNYKWKVLWGQGELKTDRLVIEATNVMGFWFSNESSRKKIGEE